MIEVVIGGALVAVGMVLGAWLSGVKRLRIPGHTKPAEAPAGQRSMWNDHARHSHQPVTVSTTPAPAYLSRTKWPTGTEGGLSKDEMP